MINLRRHQRNKSCIRQHQFTDHDRPVVDLRLRPQILTLTGELPGLQLYLHLGGLFTGITAISRRQSLSGDPGSGPSVQRITGKAVPYINFERDDQFRQDHLPTFHAYKFVILSSGDPSIRTAS
jgi:hypothetical protein